MTTIRHILVWVLVIGVLGVLLFPVFARPKVADEGMDRSQSRYAGLATALIIYASDFDDTFPAAASEQTLRALTYDYIKNHTVYEPGIHAGKAMFNFNLAGVSMGAPPYHGGIKVEPSKVIVTWARNPKKQYEFFVYYLANERGTLTSSQLLKALEPQFDRRGVVLMPADYLADQDPLKDKK
ncbi:MAG: hypothetical protein KF824_03975 [Fimbriimonadaceae bacterium]|nr:MAG: hypothetical protein KF824_03975 [Fimbriimonadaceae bacterium]